jgi:hypothetical protein
MPKKNCCCNTGCDWCDHDHYAYTKWYDAGDPLFDSGNVDEDSQPNWKILGTVTTELPSVGHPMLNYFSAADCPNDYTKCCTVLPNNQIPHIGLLCTSPDPFPCATTRSTLRTPITDVNITEYIWGSSVYYGDITPCWFNGINMTNIKNKDEEFFNFTFNLKIEKLIDNTYTKIIDIKANGPGKNLRPHPDTCRSFNVNDGVDFPIMSNCKIFFSNETDDGGNFKPCYRDFARMPRGPWPYRLKTNKQPDPTNSNCLSSNGKLYTKQEVEKAKAGTIPTNGTYPATRGGYIESNILNCTYKPTSCTTSGSDGGINTGGDSDAGNVCNTAGYCNSTEYANELDDEGTPYGWEDCPASCPDYSNFNDITKLKFFCWLNQYNRYTTPEWDLIDKTTEVSKKISLHVLVPTKGPIDSKFCDGPEGGQGYGFGEWCFGMDYEAPNEIDMLENAGYQWSNGREKDGIWINKTPTNALRVLFTLDHADLDQGKVWRVFRDWDVTVNEYVKTFNEGKSNEQKFKITLTQKVEEVQLCSLGCDCPSGYVVNSDGTYQEIEPA